MSSQSLTSLQLLIKKEILEAKKQLFKSHGMDYFENENGFSQSQLYSLAGKNDCGVSISFRPNSESWNRYGNSIFVVFVYTQKERKSLENDISSLDEVECIKCKILSAEYDMGKAHETFIGEIPTKDIIDIAVSSNERKENTFTSNEKRKPYTIEIPFHSEGNGNDIYWMYNSLALFKEKGIALTPEEENQYLAFKIILHKNELTDDEKKKALDDEGKINSMEVLYHLLLWKKEANQLTEIDKRCLNQITILHNCEIVRKVNEGFTNCGLGLEKYCERYPEKAQLLMEKAFFFHETRYNNGKHLLYMNLDSFLHIYPRHVAEMRIKEQYADKDRFQLELKDIETVIGIVLRQINDEYQSFKDENPNKPFRKIGT